MDPNRVQLLSDEQISRFITDGFLILQPDVPAEVHERIDERLLWMVHKEQNPGNNVLPLVPEMYEVLNSPVIRGALGSILGHDYVLHPHRFVHNNEPGRIEDGVPKVGEGSRSFVGWHQDDHSPLSRPRHHYPRYAMILYYPHDTPIELGPTQIIPATQLNSSISDEDRARGFQAAGPAGTCVLVHFDLAHGGSLNVGDRTRNMAKFVFCRCSEPAEPAWDNQRADWQTPDGHLAPAENCVVWRHHWEWMSGRNSAHDLQPSVARYADALQTGNGGWNEGAVVMEDAAYALAAIGKPAVRSLKNLMKSENEWARINAAFALGEMGSQARSAMKQLIGLLQDDSHAVVRTTLDAIGQIRAGSKAALPEIERLLASPPEAFPEAWTTKQRRNWKALSQVRINAVMCLLRMGPEAKGAERWLWECLDDECGYVGGFGVEFLLRRGTPLARAAALGYLYRHRWDSTLRVGMRTF